MGNMMIFVSLMTLCMLRISDALYCKATVGVKGGPALPNLPSSFQSNVEVKIEDQGYTEDAIEYVDGLGNRAALVSYANGNKSQIILDYANDQVFIISTLSDNQKTCMVSNLTTSPAAELFGYRSSNGRLVVSTPSGVLKFGKKFGEVYVGGTNIRGMPVDHWRSCQYTQNANGMANYTVDYYFTESNWTTATGESRIPVRAEIKGVQTQNKNTRKIHHIYDYYNFRPFIQDNPDNIFQTPTDVVCPGRKKTNPLPTLSAHYYYRQEIVIPIETLVQHSNVWYDYHNRLVRKDYRPTIKAAPFWTTNSLSRVDDYNSGVSYIKDLTIGNCTVSSISNSSFDTKDRIATLSSNGSITLVINNPMQMFQMDNTYTYEGQRTVRGVLCNVYISVQQDYIIQSKLHANCSFVYYFMADGWSNYNLNSNDVSQDTPIRLEVSALAGKYQATYDFFDFSEEQPPMNTFDISSCYSSLSKLHFQLRIPGLYYSVDEKELVATSQQRIAQLMNVKPLRVQNVYLGYDDMFIYIYGAVLDRTPALAQFQLSPGKRIEKSGNWAYSNVYNPVQCAMFCVAHSDFACNSFDLCSSDNTCYMSKTPYNDGKIVLNTTQNNCDHYTRIIHQSVLMNNTHLDDAWYNLRAAVLAKQFKVIITRPEGSSAEYEAVDVKATNGKLTTVPLPSMTGQFSYGLETSFPGQYSVQSSNVWYDTSYNLVRLDYRNKQPVAPFYTTSSMSAIHDFNTGVSYHIDNKYGNCTIGPIKNDSYYASFNFSTVARDNTNILHMKNPLKLFSLDKNYAYSGVGTVRNQMCNVFESRRHDYILPNTPPFASVVETYFLTDDWRSYSDNGGRRTKDVPTRMLVSSTDYFYYIAYDFFNFNEEHPDLRNFNIKPCFSEWNQKSLQIRFKDANYTDMQTRSEIFMQAAVSAIADTILISPLRMQDVQLEYDVNYVYLSFTMLEVPAMGEFTRYPSRKSTFIASGVISVPNARQCAAACVSNTLFSCTSFDFCGHKCIMLTQMTISGKDIQTTDTCDRYVRDVTNIVPQLLLAAAYKSLVSTIKQGQLFVQLPLNKTYYENYMALAITNELGSTTKAPPKVTTPLKTPPSTMKTQAPTSPAKKKTKPPAVITKKKTNPPTVTTTAKSTTNSQNPAVRTKKTTSKKPVKCPTLPAVMPSQCPTSAIRVTTTLSSGYSTGTMAGATIGCVLLGLVIGLFVMFVFHRRQKKVLRAPDHIQLVQKFDQTEKLSY